MSHRVPTKKPPQATQILGWVINTLEYGDGFLMLVKLELVIAYVVKYLIISLIRVGT